MLRKVLISIISLFVLASGAYVDACGDRLLVMGRGVRFQRETAEYPARILHYMVAKNTDPATMTDDKLQALLNPVGHRFHSARSATEFENELKTRAYDLVLISIGEVPRFEEMIRTAAAKPLLLPFIYGGTKSEASAAKKRYGVVLKAPAKEAHILETIDQAMELRERHARKTD